MSNKNEIIIVKEMLDDSHTGLFCPICEFILSSYSDIENIKNNMCCEECFLEFGQARKSDWESGWRPSKVILDRYKRKRRILNIRLDEILGE